MSQLIDLEAIAIEHLKSESFSIYLAECISTLYRDKLMDEFGSEVAKATEKLVKESASNYLETFGKEDIQNVVDQAIRNITKAELLLKLIER